MLRFVSPVAFHRFLLPFIIVLLGSGNLIAQCQNNVLPNPGFEQGLSDWTILGMTDLADDAVSGSFSAEIIGDGNRIFQTIPANPGNEYSLTQDLSSWMQPIYQLVFTLSIYLYRQNLSLSLRLSP